MRSLRLFFLVFIMHIPLHAQQITIIGCGYVGLTMAGILSFCKHHIICVDINQERIHSLQNKQLPFYEPQLYDLLFVLPHAPVSFINEIDKAMNSEIFYICTDTPLDQKNHCDLSFVRMALNDIITHVNDTENKIICIKSTVPPGTMRQLSELVPNEKKHNIQLVYNPEFMREGSAITDIRTTNPIVLAGKPAIVDTIEHLYSPLIHNNICVVKTNYETAEIIKYAWNTFSAMRIAYVNELSVLCKQYNADITAVVQGLALSELLLPTNYLKPGPGYGGSCLPKDLASFRTILEQKGIYSSFVHQAVASNKKHQENLIADIFNLLGRAENQKTVTLLGLAFKAGTNDIRNSSAIPIINALISKGVTIKAYDAKAIKDMQQLFPDICYFDSPYEAIKDTDLIIILTECATLQNLDLDLLASLCNKKVIIDTRNLYNPELLKKHGFTYVSMGLLS